MAKKKGGGGGGGQYHLPKHLRNSGKGGGGGGGSSSSSSTTSSSSSSTSVTSGGQVSNVGEMSAFQLTHQPLEVLYKLSPEQVVERVASLIRRSTRDILEEGETLYLRYVYLEPDEAMKKRCNLLKTRYEDLCKLFELESFKSEFEINVNLIHENEKLFEDIQDVSSAISNQITIYDNRAMLYKLGGLTHVCDLCCTFRYIVPHIIDHSLNAKCSKFIENSLLALTFIIFKISDHVRGREILKQSGMFGTLWDISQYYSQYIDNLIKGKNTEWYKLDSVVSETVTSIMYHIGEILSFLTEEYSLEDDLEKLLLSANPKWFPTVGMNEKFGRFTSDVHFAVINIPELLDWSPDEFNQYISQSNLRLCVEDFDIHTHYPIIKARSRSKFLHSSNVVKWNPQTGLVEYENANFGPGYYILRGDHHPTNTLAFVKFIQFLYCEDIKKYQSDYDYLNGLVPSNLSLGDQQNEIKKKESEMCDSLVSFNIFIQNDASSKLLQTLVPQYKSSGIRSGVSQAYGCIFDDTDKKLFAIHRIYSISLSQNQIENYKKAYIKSLSTQKKISSISSDFVGYFSNEHMKSEQKYDIQLKCNGNIVDEEIKSNNSNIQFNDILSSFTEEGGISSHRCILACRSEYLRKVLEYESISHNNSTGMDEFFIQNISATTLYIINWYMYCGVTVFANKKLPTESLIECFVVSDLYMLFGLKKFAEERLCEVLGIWKKSFSSLKPENVASSLEMEIIEELHEIATVHLAVNMKSDCFDLLKEYKTRTPSQ